MGENPGAKHRILESKYFLHSVQFFIQDFIFVCKFKVRNSLCTRHPGLDRLNSGVLV